jgi:hypothetical protein
LFLEDALQAGEDDEALPLIVVVDNSKLDLAISLFDYGRLYKGVRRYVIFLRGVETHTFSGKGIAGTLMGFFTSSSTESSCFTRLLAVGDDGSSEAFLLGSTGQVLVPYYTTMRQRRVLLRTCFLHRHGRLSRGTRRAWTFL